MTMSVSDNKKIRILVVDDSAFMRKVLESIFHTDSQLQVVGTAKDGNEAIALAESLKPDVITMDVNMPHLDGIQATRQIMTHNPCPIVVVSSESRESAHGALCALELGAIDFVSKPANAVDLDMKNIQDDLIRKVRMASKVRVVRTASRLGAPLPKAAPAPAASVRPATAAETDQRFPIVVIGASTGGPATVMRLAPGFTREFPAAVLLVQHMPGSFTAQYAMQLSEFTGLAVKEAVHNERLFPGTLYICPGAKHMRIIPPGRIVLEETGRIAGYLPNIDVTLESVAAFAGANSICAILTGMGNDGAKGARSIKKAGGLVIAQDEATSVIFGMPSEAIKAGAVDHILPIDDIYGAIEKRVLAISRTLPAGVRG